jgi:hypothetical protein
MIPKTQPDLVGSPIPAPVRIPTPPPARGRRRRRSGFRGTIWLGAFALGVGLGLAAYPWLQGVDVYFDYWLALVS